jgi:DHA1 family bicyclomycin/chloramphenicol resistance-like MFS transporter
MVYLSSSQQIFQNQYDLKEEFPYILPDNSNRCSCFFEWSIGNKVWNGKLITTALVSFLVVSATYIALFYNTPNQMFVFCCCFLQCNFSVYFFGNLRAMAMELWDTLRGLQRLLALFLLSWPFLSAFGRFIADRALPLFVGFSICATLSVGLLIYLKIDEKRVNITSENRI